MGEPNLLLAALIERARLSNAGLARRVNDLGGHRLLRYDHASVARWIRDHAIPRDPAPQVICQILSEALGEPVTLADIGMDRSAGRNQRPSLHKQLDQAVALWRGEQAGRVPTSTETGAEAITPVWEWENPPHDLDVSRTGRRPVNMTDVRRLRELRVRYQEMYRRVGGVPVRPRLIATLNEVVAPLLDDAYDNATGRELLRAAGGLAALAGVCAYDADMQPLSQRHLFRALRMAKASGDRWFGAYILAVLATQALHIEQNQLVVQYADVALRGARGRLSPALATDLHALAGKAYARMSDASTSRQHLRQSESLAGRINSGDEPAEVSYVQPGLFEVQIAEELRRLGDLTAAQTYAEEAVRTAGNTHLRGQVHRHATLALILAQRGEIEQALDAATTMLDIAVGMESGRLRDRIATVAQRLRPHAKVPGVADFLERVAIQV